MNEVTIFHGFKDGESTLLKFEVKYEKFMIE